MTGAEDYDDPVFCALAIIIFPTLTGGQERLKFMVRMASLCRYGLVLRTRSHKNFVAKTFLSLGKVSLLHPLNVKTQVFFLWMLKIGNPG